MTAARGEQRAAKSLRARSRNSGGAARSLPGRRGGSSGGKPFSAAEAPRFLVLAAIGGRRPAVPSAFGATLLALISGGGARECEAAHFHKKKEGVGQGLMRRGAR